ncbi:MAG: CoA transferase [Sandaracinus sp.]|nr:CoA transferase [Myxococcales bacterium]MAT24098.1 CoA transferase [Sandaracinus sp.]MBJ71886.1 CoA transferase [Sandaracinus sp.]
MRPRSDADRASDGNPVGWVCSAPVSDDALPLAGLKVLDFTQNLPGPYASFMLASLGAEVVKVEPPKGDPGRFMEPFFSFVNRGKRSVMLDLRDPASRPALEALVERSDVLLEGFRPGVMKRLGADWETCRALNPRLVYCSISAFGQEGPRASEPGHDLNLQALSGASWLERDARGMPRGTVLPIADLSSSLVAVASICAALASRGPEGEGHYLDVAMADAVVSWAHLWGRGVDLAAGARAQVERSPAAFAMRPLTAPLIAILDRVKLYAMPHYGIYRCRDGEHVALGVVDEKHFWKGLCEVLGLRRLEGLPMPARIAAGPALRPVLAAILATKPADHWLRALEAAGVPACAVLKPEEAAREKQFLFRGLYDERGLARAPLPGATHLDAPAPKLGEHTEALLRELGVA